MKTRFLILSLVIIRLLEFPVNTYAQSPERVLSAEEFRQRIIEEKRQQLKQMIQVEANDRMRYGYFAGQINVYVFLANTYSFHEQIQAIEGKNNELNAIMKACSDEIKKMFFDEVKDFFFPYLKDKSLLKKYRNPDWDKLKIKYNIFLNRFLDTFNEFLAASPENREKVAQAIRDYRLTEFIKNELPDREAERFGELEYIRLSNSHYRFIGFTLSFGLTYPYSDENNHYDIGKEGLDKYNFPPFFADFNVSFAYLFRAANKINIGFIIETGIAYINQPSMVSLGGKLMLGLKLDRVLITIGSYIYFKVYEKKHQFDTTATFKNIDMGVVGSMGYLFGSRMNYLLAFELRVNLNKNLKTMKLVGYPGTLVNPDEVGFVGILCKFGYGF